MHRVYLPENPLNRFSEHNDPAWDRAHYSAKHRPWTFVWLQEYPTRAAAMCRERFIKSRKSVPSLPPALHFLATRAGIQVSIKTAAQTSRTARNIRCSLDGSRLCQVADPSLAFKSVPDTFDSPFGRWLPWQDAFLSLHPILSISQTPSSSRAVPKNSSRPVISTIVVSAGLATTAGSHFIFAAASGRIAPINVAEIT